MWWNGEVQRRKDLRWIPGQPRGGRHNNHKLLQGVANQRLQIYSWYVGLSIDHFVSLFRYHPFFLPCNYVLVSSWYLEISDDMKECQSGSFWIGARWLVILFNNFGKLIKILEILFSSLISVNIDCVLKVIQLLKVPILHSHSLLVTYRECLKGTDGVFKRTILYL